jgi:hypothetical protein
MPNGSDKPVMMHLGGGLPLPGYSNRHTTPDPAAVAASVFQKIAMLTIEHDGQGRSVSPRRRPETEMWITSPPPRSATFVMLSLFDHATPPGNHDWSSFGVMFVNLPFANDATANSYERFSPSTTSVPVEPAYAAKYIRCIEGSVYGAGVPSALA